MPIPLIALVAGAAGLKFQARGRRQTAFNTALTSFTHDPGGVGPPLPGHESGSMLNPQQAAGLQNLYRSNPQQATLMLNSIMGRNQTAHQNTLTRELQWENVSQARQTHALQVRKANEQERQFGINNDLNVIRERKEAQDLGALYVNDPLFGNARVRTDAPGTKAWRELQTNAIATAQSTDTMNKLIAHTAKFGVIRSPEMEGFGVQDSLRTQMIGEIKSMLTLGALDEGVLTFATGLVGSRLSVEDFVLGDDAASLERLLTTQNLFNNQMTLRAEDLRLLQGVNPELTQGFSTVQQQSAQLNQFVQERVARVRAAGGNVTDLIERPGDTFLGDEARGGPVQLVEPQSSLEALRSGAAVFGNQIDTITSGIIGALVGRGIK